MSKKGRDKAFNNNTFNDVYSDPFAGFSVDGLEKVKKGTFMDKNAVSDYEMDEIITTMMDRVLPPMKFDNNDTGSVLKHTIDPAELFSEFSVAIEFGRYKIPDAHKHITILHQIPDDSIHYKQLFQWSKLNEVMESFFLPIHYQIYCKREYNDNILSSTENNNNNNNNSDQTVPNIRNINQVDVRMKEFQDKIIASHFVKKYLLSRELLRCIEHGSIDVTLHKLILHKNIGMFLFQWSEPTPFSFVMGFTLDYADPRVNHFLSSKFIHLSRKELVEWNEPTEDEKKRLESSEWMEDDQVSSDKALDLYILNMSLLKKELQSTFISYITLAYIRRD